MSAGQAFGRAAAQIGADFAHGHGELVLPDCALCVAELNAVIDWCHRADEDEDMIGGAS